MTMLTKRKLIGVAIATMTLGVIEPACAQATIPKDERPTQFSRRVGGWFIGGDPAAGGCVAIPPFVNTVEFLLAVAPADETIRFTLSNHAWNSLHEGDIRINAVFMKNGKAVDIWDLDAQAEKPDIGDPKIFFDIWRSKNDGESFISNFKQSQQIVFMRDTVPIAAFSLEGSGRAVEALLDCRDMLRRDPSFDPFAARHR